MVFETQSQNLWGVLCNRLPSEAFSYRLINDLPLWGLSLILIGPTLNLCTQLFTVDFMITFRTHHTSSTFLCEFYYPKHFLAFTTELTLLLILGYSYLCRCQCYFSHCYIIFNWLLWNFAYAQQIPSVTCEHTVSVPHCYHICDAIRENIHKVGNLFLKLLGQRISILSFEWKCVKVVPNNSFVKVLD